MTFQNLGSVRLYLFVTIVFYTNKHLYSMETLHLSEVIVKYTTDKFYFNTDNKYKTFIEQQANSYTSMDHMTWITGVMMLEIQLCRHRNNYILKYIKIQKLIYIIYFLILPLLWRITSWVHIYWIPHTHCSMNSAVDCKLIALITFYTKLEINWPNVNVV